MGRVSTQIRTESTKGQPKLWINRSDVSGVGGQIAMNRVGLSLTFKLDWTNEWKTWTKYKLGLIFIDHVKIVERVKLISKLAGWIRVWLSGQVKNCHPSFGEKYLSSNPEKSHGLGNLDAKQENGLFITTLTTCTYL